MHMCDKKLISIHDRVKLVKFMSDKRYAEDTFDMPDTIYGYDIKCIQNDNLSKALAEKILLTHYLVYICDRQMPYLYIFYVGGFVLSQLADEFTDKTKVKDLIEKYVDFDTCAIKAKIKNVSQYKMISDDYYQKYKKFPEFDKPVEFISRYCSIDIISIIKTLQTLEEKYNFSIGRFLKSGYENADDLAKNIYNLTYNVPSVKKDKLEKDNYMIYLNKKKDVNKIDRYRVKRIWCLLRDFLCYPIYSECFRVVLDLSKDEFEKYKHEQLPKL